MQSVLQMLLKVMHSRRLSITFIFCSGSWAMVPVFFDRTIPFPKRWQPLAKVSHCAELQFSFGASRGWLSEQRALGNGCKSASESYHILHCSPVVSRKLQLDCPCTVSNSVTRWLYTSALYCRKNQSCCRGSWNRFSTAGTGTADCCAWMVVASFFGSFVWAFVLKYWIGIE